MIPPPASERGTVSGEYERVIEIADAEFEDPAFRERVEMLAHAHAEYQRLSEALADVSSRIDYFASGKTTWERELMNVLPEAVVWVMDFYERLLDGRAKGEFSDSAVPTLLEMKRRIPTELADLRAEAHELQESLYHLTKAIEFHGKDIEKMLQDRDQSLVQASSSSAGPNEWWPAA